MKLTFQLLSNKKFVLDGIESTDTFAHIKQRIIDEQQLGKALSDIKLIVMAKVLKDEMTVGSTAIKENATVVCMVSKIKPKPAEVANGAAGAGEAVVIDRPEPVVVNQPLALAADAVLNPPFVEVPMDEAAIANLMALGFERDPVITALQRARGRGDIAAEILFAAQDRAAAHAVAHPRYQQQQQQNNVLVHPEVGAVVAAEDDEDEDDVNDDDGDGDDNAAAAMADVPAPEAAGEAAGLAAAAMAMVHQVARGQQQAALINQIAMRDPEFQELYRQNPQMMQAVVQAMGQPNVMGQMLQQVLGGGGAIPAGPPPPQPIELTAEERDHLAMLQAMSGQPDRACLEAYLVCERNFDQAANFLLEHA